MRKKRFLRGLAVICLLLLVRTCPVKAEEHIEQEPDFGLEIDSKYGLLMEVSTGEILYEKDGDTAAAPASVTKIMTMLLIFDALEAGEIQLNDMVTVSERAASMGGSQVYLEEGEQQTVDTMLKCIAVASANDACVAMAEHIAGSEEAFVEKMNQRSKDLGMENTNFVNCNGLDAQNHKMSAKDVAIMSRELILKYPQVYDYSTIWTENIIHATKKGNAEFGLANTNKLLRQYEYCTGLKTGSTSEAGFCVSATAKKDGMKLIAVVMNGETSKIRFSDAKEMLNYGFLNYHIYQDEPDKEFLENAKVIYGIDSSVETVCEKKFSCVLGEDQHLAKIEKRKKLPESIEAPVEKGQILGVVEYYYEDEKIGEVHVLAEKSVEKAGFIHELKRVWLAWMM